MTATPLSRTVIAVLGGATLVVPLAFLVGSSIVPVPLRVILVALWLSAVVSPAVAILLLAVIAPFGSVLLSAFDAAPIQYTEALVLATLSGTMIAAGRRRRVNVRPLSPDLSRPAIVFSTVVLCSLAAVLAVSQVGIGVRWPFIQRLATLLARDYLISPPGQWASLTAAARLLEGVVLLLVVVRHAREGATHSLHIMRAMAAAGAMAAALTITQLGKTLAASQSFRELATALLTGRFSVHVADTNAAGSYYAMTGLVAVGLALQQRERPPFRRVWGLIAAALFASMWLSGSRAAVVAVAAVVIAAAIAATRWTQRWPLWSMTLVAVAVAGFVAFAIGFDPRAVDRRSLLQALSGRAAFTMTGLQMMAAAPVFGAGVGRYFETSGRFMPQSIYWFHFHENAHNNFLQVGGELGLVGLAAFVWLLAVLAVRISGGLRAFPDDRVAAGALAGLAAFVVTWLAGHPLLTPEVAIPFWILTGAAIARADGHRESAPAAAAGAAPPSAIRRRVSLAFRIAMLLLVTSVPLRARSEAAALNLAEQSFGFYDWEGEPATGRFRWTTPSAAFFVAPQLTELDMPMCAAWADHRRDPTVVTFAIDGHVFHKVETRSGDWGIVRLRLPATTRKSQYRRVDVITEPSWSPAVVLGTRDSRVLGVQMGEAIGR